MDRHLDWNVEEPQSLVLALRDDLIVRPRQFQGQTDFVFEDPLATRFFRVGSAEQTFLKLLDGHRTVREAIALAASHLGAQAFQEREAIAICRWGVENGLLVQRRHGAGTDGGDERRGGQRRKQAFPWNLLALRIPLAEPDRWLDVIAPHLTWLFSWPAFVIWLCTLGLAGWLAWPASDDLWHSAAQIVAPQNWLCLFVTWLVLKAAHEAGHAIACKRFGASVREVGVALLLLSPVAYVDVTPAWRLSSKWQRIAIAAAGMYVELFLAALALIVWANTSQVYVRWIASQVFLTAGVHTLLANANPLIRFDGYQILADWVEIPNLQSVANRRLLGQFRWVLSGERPPEFEHRRPWRWFISIYGWLAAAWRMALYAVITLVLLSLHGVLGLALAGVLCAAWLLLPAWNAFRAVRAVLHGCRPNAWRLATLSTAGAMLLFGAGIWWLGPARLVAPGIIEFAPVHIVRARTAGFVRQVQVRNGEFVEFGQVLLVLDHPEAELELAELDVKIRQSHVQDNIHRRNQDLAKLYIEEANRSGLKKKRQELQDKLDQLTIRAPAAGQVLSRSLDQLPGQFLKEGAEFAIVGNPGSKEVLVAVSQDDVQWLAGQSGRTIHICPANRLKPPRLGRLERVEPLAREELPHPALAAINGGPMAVALEDRNATEHEHPPLLRPLRPVFVARIALVESDAQEFRSGEQALMRLSFGNQSRGSRLLQAATTWLRWRLDGSQ